MSLPAELSSVWRPGKLLLGAAALRLGLVLAGVGSWLMWAPSVSTPANSMLGIREGLALQSLDVSPYAGSICRAPPVALWLHRMTAQHQQLYMLPNLASDLASGLLLRSSASQLLLGTTNGPG